MRVMLMSLRAGGVGLNLAAASHVFIMDPWWHVAAEEQAIGRSYRFGQKKDVNVIRFTVGNTIEQKIQLLQAKKKAIADGSGCGDSAEKSREAFTKLTLD